MANFSIGGWTAASLLPSLAAGFSPGAAWPLSAPAQVTPNPNSIQAALSSPAAPVKKQTPVAKPPVAAGTTDGLVPGSKTSRTTFQNKILTRILGADFSKSSISQSGANPAVNALSAPPKVNLAAIMGLPQI